MNKYKNNNLNMKENTIVINYCNSERNDQNLSFNNKSVEMIGANNRSVLSLQNIKVHKKRRKSKKYSIPIPRKDFILENMDEEKKNEHPVMEVKKKLENSLLFTGRKLKEKIEKNLSTQMGNTSLNNNSELLDNMEETKKTIITNQTNQSFNSVVKRNIQKSMKNKNLKRRRKFSNFKEKNRKLFQAKHVYDSLEDSEDIISSSEETFYISPETNFIYIFDFIILFCLTVCIIYIPLIISFHKNNCLNLNIIDKILFYFIDTIFLIDLIMGFYRGYYNNELKMITKKSLITNHFLKTYFFYDLISALPCCSFLIYYYSDICALYNKNNNDQHLFILFLSFSKLVKCIKIKINKFAESIYDLCSKNFLAEKFFEILKMVLITFSILHILVCWHIFIGHHFYPSWLSMLQGNNSINGDLSIYIASLYCLITTLTTVGYGDIVCISFAERIFQLIELSLGVIIYSYIVSKLGDYVKIESYATMIYNNNSAILEDIRVTHPKMPFKLYNQILHHLQTNFQQQKKSDINLLINSLPHALKYTLLFVINKNYVNHFYFFKKCYNSNFIAYSLVNFVPITYRKNALIIKEDELIDNAIFVADGRLSLEIAIDLDNPEKSIKKYLDKKYNRLKRDDKNRNSTLNGSATIELFETRKTLNELKTFVTKCPDINDDKGFDYSKIERGFDESNYQFLNVTNIFKNEHYGEVFIILNKPSPLYVRVKSKKANLFLLNKKHIMHLSTNFVNIWKRIFRKSLKNMKAFKRKTAQIAKNYSVTYNVRVFSSFIKKNENNTKRISLPKTMQKTPNDYRKKSAMIIARNSLKCFIAENLRDIKKKSTKSLKNNYTNSLFAESKREDEDTVEEKGETKRNEEKFEEALQKIINTTNNSCKTNNYLNNDDFNQKSKTIEGQKEQKIKSNIDSSKLIQRFSTNLAMNQMNQTQVNKLLIELRKEIKKRNNYLRLFNEANEKVNTLYSQLVDNTIDVTNHIDKIGNLDTQICNNIDINKIVLNNINSDNIIGSNMNFSLSNKNDSPHIKPKLSKKMKKASNNKVYSSLTMSSKAKTKFKSKDNKRPLSKFDKKNKSNIDHVFINLNRPVLIFNSSRSIENKENKDKDGTLNFNKSFTIKNSVMKENLDTIPKSNKDNQNDLSSFISDISHTSILQQKLKGK